LQENAQRHVNVVLAHHQHMLQLRKQKKKQNKSDVPLFATKKKKKKKKNQPRCSCICLLGTKKQTVLPALGRRDQSTGETDLEFDFWWPDQTRSERRFVLNESNDQEAPESATHQKREQPETHLVPLYVVSCEKKQAALLGNDAVNCIEQTAQRKSRFALVRVLRSLIEHPPKKQNQKNFRTLSSLIP
jgi:hypothetical protein